MLGWLILPGMEDAASHEQIERLREQGFVVLPKLVSRNDVSELSHTARSLLAERHAPLEYEADLQYPGAPASRTAAGGQTVRRLLDAYGRAAVFRRWAMKADVGRWMERYFGESVLMSRAHHNCLMTKHPLYGSLTGWHRDSRYWSFDRDDLVSVWLALGVEEIDNGALWFVPGSHRTVLNADRFDEAKFLRGDRVDNAALAHTAESPRLEPGDAVFFHSNTLHSAGKNLTQNVKFSLVYTYHGASNAPTPGTRSDSQPEVHLNVESE